MDDHKIIILDAEDVAYVNDILWNYPGGHQHICDALSSKVSVDEIVEAISEYPDRVIRDIASRLVSVAADKECRV